MERLVESRMTMERLRVSSPVLRVITAASFTCGPYSAHAHHSGIAAVPRS